MKILFATTNTGKMNEVRTLLADLPVELFMLGDMERAVPPPEETGRSFRENALLKGAYYHAHYRLPVIADDSGLTVPALNGKPGIFSARYAGAQASDEENNRRLLKDMQHLRDKDRRAFFKAVVAFVSDTESKTFEGVCPGFISPKPVGRHGFGYDPLFFIPEYNRTFAEMDIRQKNRISHRSAAFRALKEWLKTQILIDLH